MRTQHSCFSFLRRLSAATLLGGLCIGAIAGGSAQEEANKKLVLEFQRVVLNGKDADAVPRYVGDTYTQHNPRVPDGPAALQGFVRQLRTNAPDAFSEVKRAVADGDLVVLHSHQKRNKDDRGTALIDIFRVENGKLVEHWDVMQPVPETSANPNTMF